MGVAGNGAPFIDYAARSPRLKAPNYIEPVTPGQEEPALDKSWDVGYLRPTAPNTDALMLGRQGMLETYTYGTLAGTRIRVIGQPDLTVDGERSDHPAAKEPKGLIARGPAWSALWNDETVEALAA